MQLLYVYIGVQDYRYNVDELYVCGYMWLGKGEAKIDG